MRQSGILVGIVMVLASWASASSMDAGDGFDELTTRIRQVCRYSPNESWSLVNDAEALLTPESSFASRVELILARAPATAMRKGYDSALGEVLDLIDEALAHGDTEDWIPRIRTAAADLACRHGSFLFGFEQFLEGLKWVDSKTRRSTRLMLLEQGTRISLMMGMPHLSWDILKEFDSLDGYIDPDCRPVGLILKAEVEGAMGDLDGMNQTIEELELAKGVHFQDELLKQFWVLKVKYSLLKGRLGVAERYLNEAHGTSTPHETDSIDGLMYWYHAVVESLKGSGEDEVREWLEKSMTAYRDSGRPGQPLALLVQFIKDRERSGSSEVASVFHEFLSVGGGNKDDLFSTAYGLYSRAQFYHQSEESDRDYHTMKESRSAMGRLVHQMDILQVDWTMNKSKIQTATSLLNQASFYYVLLLFLLFVIFILVLILRIRTQRQINLRLKDSVEKSRIAEQAAEHASKLKSQFVSNISHEIKTPMSGLVGMASILDELVTDPVQRTYLDTIRVCSRNLLVMMDDLLDLGRIESGRLEIERKPFNPGETFTYCHQLALRNAESKDLLLAFEIDDSVPDFLVGDSTRLGQILTNLINNAIKFTDSGTVSILAHFEEAKNDSGRMIISVSDTGRGIEAKRLNTVFEPFNQEEQGKPFPQEGNGLGLAISKSLVDLMKGTIMVVSEVGKGSTFTVTLPFEAHFENPELA